MKKKISFNQIENIALYFGVLILIILDLLSTYIPVLSSYFNSNSAPLYIVTLLVFRILFKQISELKKSLVPNHTDLSSFNDRMQFLIKRKNKFRSIDFFATSSRKFYHAIEDVDFYAEEIRILIYHKTPDLDRIKEMWEKLQERGKCKKITIKTYRINPTFYGLVINNEEGLFGFFEPNYLDNSSSEFNYMQIRQHYTLSKSIIRDQQIVLDIRLWFNKIFDSHSEILLSSIID